MTTKTTLELLKEAMGKPSEAPLAKAFTQSNSPTSGLTYYDLEAPAKSFVPVLTPLRNRIARVSGAGGIQASWRAITGINVTNAGIGLSEGNRGAITATTVTDYTAAYKGFGLDDNVTFEAQYAGQNFDDVKAIAVQNLLRSTMIGEERMILGGNASVALGTTPTPTLATATTGGAIGATVTVSVVCVALAMEGLMAASMANGVPTATQRTLADGTVEAYNMGTAQRSTAATIATGAGTTNTVTATVAPVNGALGYAWYAGTAGNERLFAITTNNRIVITSLPSTTQTLSTNFTTDRSSNSTHFDGILTQIFRSGSGAYINTLPANTALTADGVGGVVEIDTALQYFWDAFRLSPTSIWMNAQEMQNVSRKVLSGATNSLSRFSFNVSQGMIGGGVSVKSYLNKFSLDGNVDIPLMLHPNLPAGTIMFWTDSLPYPLSGVTNVCQMRMRKEYYQIEYPLRTRRYEYGVYADGVLQCYFPPAFGVITNITNG